MGKMPGIEMRFIGYCTGSLGYITTVEGEVMESLVDATNGHVEHTSDFDPLVY